MTFENLLLDRDGAVAVITINRPQVLNALNISTLDELRRAVLDVRADPAIRAVVVTGAGDKAFVAGADINELAAQRPSEGKDHARFGQHVFDLIENLGKPVIAAVNGFALGGGNELAMACTIRVAADTARFGQPEIDLGLIPGFAGTNRLARLIGRGAALDLLLTGRQIPADEAMRLGLVTRVVPAAELRAAAQALAAALAAKPPVAIRCLIEALTAGAGDRGEALEAALFGVVASTRDMREGTRAFLEKRAPVFSGE